MGCFVGCFGYSTKHRRRKPAKKLLQGHQGQGLLGSYEPLHSSFSLKLDITEKPMPSDSQSRDFRDKTEEPSSVRIRIRKKVSFNLNVTTYEPLPTAKNSTDAFLGSDEEKSCGRSKEDTEKEKPSTVDSGMGTYPLNYRYYNCEDSYDEDADEDEDEDEDGDEDEDEDFEYELDDLDDEDANDSYHDDESDGGHNVDDDLGTSQEFTVKLCSVPMKSQNILNLTQMADEKINNLMPLHAAQDQQVKTLGSTKSGRDRSQHEYSVLNPVENLTQWKEIKAKSKPPSKHKRKENIAHKPVYLETPVDASLSNWLISSEIMPLKENSGKSDFKCF